MGIVKSPLKYMGSKYYYIKQYKHYFNTIKYDHLVDAFGGSATISLNFKGNKTTYLKNELDIKLYYISSFNHRYFLVGWIFPHIPHNVYFSTQKKHPPKNSISITKINPKQFKK